MDKQINKYRVRDSFLVRSLLYRLSVSKNRGPYNKIALNSVHPTLERVHSEILDTKSVSSGRHSRQLFNLEKDISWLL